MFFVLLIYINSYVNQASKVSLNISRIDRLLRSKLVKTAKVFARDVLA
jgi:hypothetical protein